MLTKPTFLRFIRGLKLVFLILLSLTHLQCQKFYVPQGINNPSIETYVPLFEGAFSWAELIQRDTLSASQNPITIEQEVLNSSFDFSGLLPQDSSYYMLGRGFSITNGLAFNNSDTMFMQSDQLSFLSVFAPQWTADFNNNNNGSLYYLGFSRNNQSLSSNVFTNNSVVNTTKLKSGRLWLKVENTLDIPIEFTVAVLSGSDTIYKSSQSMSQADTLVKDLNIAGRELSTNDRIIISKVSSEYAIKAPISINNANSLSVTACYYNLIAETGAFIPKPYSASGSEFLTMPIKNPKQIKRFKANQLIFNHSVLSSDIEGNVRIKRKVYDKNGLIHSDSLFLYGTSGSINWPLDLSGITIEPDNGEIRIEKELLIGNSIHASLQAFPYVSTSYNFSPEIIYAFIEYNEDRQVSIDQITYPKTIWENGLTIDMVPRVSTAHSTLSIVGWGNAEVNTELISTTNGQTLTYRDTTYINMGNSILDSSISKNIQWTTTSEDLGEAVYFLADEIKTTSTLTFKAPWGIQLAAPNNIVTQIQSPLDSKQGSFYLASEKVIKNDFNDKMLEQLYLSDSLVLQTNFVQNRNNALNLNWSLASDSDTISHIDSTFIDSAVYHEQTIELNELTMPWIWNFNVGFEGENIIVRNRDSLSFQVFLKIHSEP